MPSIETIKEQYPLHWLVWNNDYEELESVLSKDECNKEKMDCRGRTPLMLAVTLNHLESAKVLVKYSTNVNVENCDGWTAVQEAVATGNPEMVQLLLERRDVQRRTMRIGGIPQLLLKLREAPDFYVEMRWEFSSWVSFVSRMFPSDTCKIYKQGSNVRIDTTLLGFDQNTWQRGNRSYIFMGDNDAATMMEVDHELKQVYKEQMKVLSQEDIPTINKMAEAVSARLTSPIVSTYVDTDKINFERNKSGIWGWRSDKTERVDCYSCKVFCATNVQLVTKTRTEHLSDSDKEKAMVPKTPLQSFLGIAENESCAAAAEACSSLDPTSSRHGKRRILKSKPKKESSSCTILGDKSYSSNPCKITPEEYFDPETNLDGRDIGRPKELTVKVQKFKANLWLCEDYPLSLQEQIMPIIDLMAISSTHFAKLKDFIQMQLPSGFPVKIEIPLFHILHARITFGNILGLDHEVEGVKLVKEDNGRITCIVTDSCFQTAPDYVRLGAGIRRPYSTEEDDLIRFAIKQSLMDAGTERDEVDIWEALKAQRPSRPSTPEINAEEECQLQSAIQASLAINLATPVTRNSPEGSEDSSSIDEDLSRALMLSQLHQEEEERRRKEEEEVLKRVLELSLTEQ
ncbi:UNVERIFIED_CONTAM: hypothetical protein PYX00_005438 [Menopon gallinae]